MKVTINQKVEVDISRRQQLEIARKVLIDIFEFDNISIINGNVVKIEEYHTSHYWEERTIMRRATDHDQYVFATIKHLEDMINQEN